MNKEEVDRTISLLIHQNLCVVNNGNKEYPDFVVGGTDLLKKELSKLFSLNSVSQQRELLLAYEKSQYDTTWWMSEGEITNRINDFLANNCG